MSFHPGRYLHPRHWLAWVALGLLRLIALLPWRAQQRIGACLGYAFWLLPSVPRRIARINLDLCFPDRTGGARQRLLRDSFVHMGRGIVEIGAAWWMKTEDLARKIEIVGREHLDRVRARTDRIVLFGVHFSTIELWLRLSSLPFGPDHPRQVMYKAVAESSLINDFMAHRRGMHATWVANDSMKTFAANVAAGYASTYSPDHGYPKKEPVAPYFGVETASLNSTAVLCEKTGATVVPVLLVRKPAARPGYVLEILPPLEDFPTGDPHADRCRTNALMESMIRRHPEQYMWILRRFRILADGRRPYGGPKHGLGKRQRVAGLPDSDEA